jgi:hypothetical protein
LPLAFHLTGGEASDSRNFEILLDITPRAVLGDKGYDSRTNRTAARRRAACPAIPYRENAVNKPKFARAPDARRQRKAVGVDRLAQQGGEGALALSAGMYYSITSSARASSADGTVRPSAWRF